MPDCNFFPPLIQESCLVVSPDLEGVCPSPRINPAAPVSMIFGARGVRGCAGGPGAPGLPGPDGVGTVGPSGPAGPTGKTGPKGKSGCAAASGTCAQALFR